MGDRPIHQQVVSWFFPLVLLIVLVDLWLPFLETSSSGPSFDGRKAWPGAAAAAVARDSRPATGSMPPSIPFPVRHRFYCHPAQCFLTAVTSDNNTSLGALAGVEMSITESNISCNTMSVNRRRAVDSRLVGVCGCSIKPRTTDARCVRWNPIDRASAYIYCNLSGRQYKKSRNRHETSYLLPPANRSSMKYVPAAHTPLPALFVPLSGLFGHSSVATNSTCRCFFLLLVTIYAKSCHFARQCRLQNSEADVKPDSLTGTNYSDRY